MEFVDVQCFAGGMTLGVSQAGFELVGKREAPPNPGFGTPLLEANRHLLGDKWEWQTGDSETWEPKSVPLVISNPPCSGFSGMTITAKSFHGIDSRINGCMWETVRYAAKCDPTIVVFESVTNAYSKGRPLMQQLRAELEERTGHRYTLNHVKHNVAKLGGACVRRRYFWVASRIPFTIENPVAQPRTFGDVCGDLVDRPLASDEFGHDIVYRVNRENQQFDDLAEYWVQGESISEAAWRYLNGDEVFGLPSHDHLPPSFREKDEAKLREMGSWYFMQPNKWAWNRPGKVIDGGSFTRVLHPLHQRTITFREGARIMGYPDDWNLKPIFENRGGESWLGKGVCPTAGRWLGYALRRAFENEGAHEQGGELIGDREYLFNLS